MTSTEMRNRSFNKSKIVLVFCLIFISGSWASHEEEVNRKGKYLPLFSIVSFKNEACNTNVANSNGSGNGRRSGTCLTNSECSEKGGSAQGGCASGFGVCCLFVASATGSTISQNCTYIQNPNFPSPYTSGEAVRYTINKCSKDVCFLRLDFESFTLLGLQDTEDDDNTCSDQFSVEVTSGQNIPTICGQNVGQHMYVDLGNGESYSAALTFNFADSASNRNWDIKVTQVKCNSESAPPNGCLQYHTGLTGRIKTFNFDTPNDNHLPNQEYSACIRQENGYCCVQYGFCRDELLSFSLDGVASGADTLKVDTNCADVDYIGIADSSYNCAQVPGSPFVSKLCGAKDSNVAPTFCDCTSPFSVSVRTNAAADAANAVRSRGVCVDYTQVPCTG